MQLELPMFRRNLLALVSLLAATSLSPAIQAQESAARPDDPQIAVRIARPDAQVSDRVYFAASDANYVVVIRVTPLGLVDVLFPQKPLVSSSRITSNVEMEAKPPLSMRRSAALGEVYAFASKTPFNFSKVSDGASWNSLHLSILPGGTTQSVAMWFGNEISDVKDRVSMAAAMPGQWAIVDRSYRQATPWLASFRRQQCPSLSVASGGGAQITCSPVGNGPSFVSTPQAR